MKRFLHWNGRASRSEFFSYGFGFNIAFAILSVLIGYLDGMPFLYYPLAIPLTLLSVYVSICLIIQRLHDLNKPGWYYFVFAALTFVFAFVGGAFIPGVEYIAFLLCLLGVIVMYFFKGTTGYNLYGPDPLAPTIPVTLEDSVAE